MSEKTLIQKLLIKPNHIVLIMNAPVGYLEKIGTLPTGAVIKDKPNSKFDLIQAFVSTKMDLEKTLEVLNLALKQDSIIWITYPKQTSGIKTDINRDIIWQYAEPKGFKPVAMFAVDEVWSAFRLKLV